MIDWRVVPLGPWPGVLTKERQGHRFRTSRTVSGKYSDGTTWSGKRSDSGVDWRKTTALLERELWHLDARDVVLQMAVHDRDIRNDGWIKANAKPEHPGVILSFGSKHGPLSYAVDTFDDWQANVRGIAKALEALRMVDRYGVTKSGEQYRGWKALPSGKEMFAGDIARGRQLIEEHGSARDALFATHPDRGGSPDDFRAVQAARSA